jgi:hypothetical protein
MEVEFKTHAGGDDDAEDEDGANDKPVNDCSGVLPLDRDVKVFSTAFTCKSLRAMDPDDQAMIALIISFCATNFAQQHQEVRATLETHRTVHADRHFTVYVVCVIVPYYTRYKLSALNELKALRMTRIVDVDVGPKMPNPRRLSANASEQQLRGQIQVTAHSMLNPYRLVDLTFSRLHFNTVVITNDLPNERAIIKRPRRSFEADDK